VVVVIMRWIGSKYDAPAGRLKHPWVRQTTFDASLTRRARGGRLWRKRNFSLVATGVATGVATAKIATRIKRCYQIKFLILFGEFGGRTRTRTWDPLIKSQRLKIFGIGKNQQ
jgi:hypothetical protein